MSYGLEGQDEYGDLKAVRLQLHEETVVSGFSKACPKPHGRASKAHHPTHHGTW